MCNRYRKNDVCPGLVTCRVGAVVEIADNGKQISVQLYIYMSTLPHFQPNSPQNYTITILLVFQNADKMKFLYGLLYHC